MSKLFYLTLTIVILATVAIAESNQPETAQVQQEPNLTPAAESQLTKSLNDKEPTAGLLPIIQFIVQTVLGVGMVIIAGIALSTWRRQIKAHKHIEFLDELTDTIHTFILLMSGPITHVKFAKIGIDSHKGIHNEPDDIKNPEAVAFIKKQGKTTSNNIMKCLTNVTPIVSKMKSLVAKGQIFGIDNYSECHEACSMLEWSYNQIEVFSEMIRNPNLYWRNPEIQRTLEKILSVNPDEISSNLTQQNIKFLLFAKQAYAKIIK